MRLSHSLRRAIVRTPARALSRATHPAKLDKQELKRLILRCVDDLSGSVAVQLMYIGDRLKLFGRIAEAGRAGLTATELSERAQCHPRYVETWLDACVAQSFVETTPGTAAPAPPAPPPPPPRHYWMTAAQREVLANELCCETVE